MSKTDVLCPVCGEAWTDFNFCPKDGTNLKALREAAAAGQGPLPPTEMMPAMARGPSKAQSAPPKPAPQAAKPAPQAAKPAPQAAKPTPDMDKTLLASPAVAASSALDFISRKVDKATRAPDPDSVKTAIDMKALAAEPMPPGGGARRVQPEAKKKTLGERAIEVLAERTRSEMAGKPAPPDAVETMMEPSALPPEIETRLGNKPGREQAKPAAPPAKPAAAPKKRAKGEFSETQWFMKGFEIDADLLEAKAEDEDYGYDESIPVTKRKRFTLRKRSED